VDAVKTPLSKISHVDLVASSISEACPSIAACSRPSAGRACARHRPTYWEWLRGRPDDM
jgi:hypothetical protein